MTDTCWEDIAADMLAGTENITLASLDEGGFPPTRPHEPPVPPRAAHPYG